MPSHHRLLHSWETQLRSLLPAVRVTRVRVLALFVLGVLWAGQVTLLRVAAALPLPARDASLERRLQRWLANSAVSREALWLPLLPALLAGTAGREVLLVFDPTPQREHATLLVLGLVDHQRVLPVAWRVVPQRAPWPARLGEALQAMGQEVNAALPAGCTVTLLADRGLTSPGLIDLCGDLGWHYVLRVNVDATASNWVRQAGQTAPLWGLVSDPGQHWRGAVEVFKKAGWRAVEPTIWWERGRTAPWVLISDRPGGAARVREYRRRVHAEATYADCKRRGWDLERSRLTRLDRLERLLLVLHLALWWTHQLGGRVIRQGQRARFDRTKRRDLSRRRLGLAWLQELLAQDQCPPLPFHHRHGQWRFAGLT